MTRKKKDEPSTETRTTGSYRVFGHVLRAAQNKCREQKGKGTLSSRIEKFVIKIAES